MIQLRSDCLVFRTSDGAIPCSAAQVALEFMGGAAAQIDRELVGNATAGVLHYFKEELGMESVSVGEFCQALAKVLRGFGLQVAMADESPPAPQVLEADLRQLACESGKGFELAFFPRLRQELLARMVQSPSLVRFTGLRSCVKQLAGAQRWCGRCQELNDQIVGYLRLCLSDTPSGAKCAMVVV